MAKPKKAVVVIPEPLFTWMWRVVMEQWKTPVPPAIVPKCRPTGIVSTRRPKRKR